MKKRIAPLLLCLSLCMACALFSCPDALAQEDPIVGEWLASGIYISEQLIPLSSDEELASMYELDHITIDAKSSFTLYSGAGFEEGVWMPHDVDFENPIYTLNRTVYVNLEPVNGEFVERREFSPATYYASFLDDNQDIMVIFKNTDSPDFTLVYTRKGSSAELQPPDSWRYLYSDIENPGEFTNKYGSADSFCAESSCPEYIARSGDTKFCEEHSSRCLSCDCFIDRDAVYCISCLTSGLSAGSDKPSPDSSMGSSGSRAGKGSPESSDGSVCQYSYSDGSVCGAGCTDYDSLCNRHFNELFSTYRTLIG